MQIGYKVIIIAQRVYALVERRHNGGRVLSQLHRLVQLFSLQVLEAIEEIKQILVLFEQTTRRQEEEAVCLFGVFFSVEKQERQ